MAEKRPTIIRPEKKEAVRDLSDRLDRAQIALLADYRGLTVAQMTDLRRQLGASETEIRVAKNTLAKLAMKGTPRETLSSHLEGPTAFVLGYRDPALTAKAFGDAVRAQRLTVPLKAGMLGERLLSAGDITRLGDLPGREVLLAQVVGTMQAPIAGFVNVLAGTLQALVGVLDARRQQLDETA